MWAASRRADTISRTIRRLPFSEVPIYVALPGYCPSLGKNASTRSLVGPAGLPL